LALTEARANCPAAGRRSPHPRRLQRPSGGSAGFNRSNAARNRDTTRPPRLRLAPKQTCIARLAAHGGTGRWLCHGPPKLREQPNGRLLDKQVFGVGVGHQAIAVEYQVR